ncbi:MAG: protein-L-isoaspartate O-methyltransferase [Sulfolobales archaeon]
MISDLTVDRERLINELVSIGVLKSEKVIKAISKVPRELFIPPELRKYAYLDTPLPIGFGQTISAPHMVALMTELLDVQVGDKVLEVGTGSGYQAAVLAELVGDEGHVYTVEIIKELVEFARNNLMRSGYISRVTLVYGDGSIGYEGASPYDKIVVTAAAPDIPQPLIKQLKPGGRLVIPVGDTYLQYLTVVRKGVDCRIEVERGTPCVFVPLVGQYGWRR